VLVFGDAASSDRAWILKKVLPERLIVAAGRLTLRQSAAVMQQLDLYVGVDTGPTHIAGALGTAMTVLYHPDYPGRNLVPLANPRCEAIESHTEDMGSITVDRVWASVCRHLT
jgi:heptosyltransferase-3